MLNSINNQQVYAENIKINIGLNNNLFYNKTLMFKTRTLLEILKPIQWRGVTCSYGQAKRGLELKSFFFTNVCATKQIIVHVSINHIYYNV